MKIVASIAKMSKPFSKGLTFIDFFINEIPTTLTIKEC